MNYYNIARKYVEWNNKEAFYKYANITIEEENNFWDFIKEEYGFFSSRNIEKYINKIDYIRSKL